jgi:predicted ATP-grasp superfamily ATP-dependent carboligase
LRVLLTEGSSLSARQVLYALGGRHSIDVCDPRPWLCLARYSCFVRHCFRSPVFTRDPAGYLHFLEHLLEPGRYDVLFAVHDETYLLSRFRERLRRRVAHALPEFSALERVQGKDAFATLLQEMKLSHPATRIVRSRQELEAAEVFPTYLKLPYSTAGQGVWRIDDRAALRERAERLEASGSFSDGGVVLIQEVAPGNLCVAHSVFRHGELIAAHTSEARAQGVGGSAWAKESVSHPGVRADLARIGDALQWHGPLMLDYVHDAASGQTWYLECNPRIGETGNALASGLNLCERALGIARGEEIEPVPSSPPGVRTHSVAMSLMGAAQAGGTRTQLWRHLYQAIRGWGIYANSADELTHPRADALSLIPSAYVSARLLLRPGSVHGMVGGTVTSYALTREAAARIRGLPEDV